MANAPKDIQPDSIRSAEKVLVLRAQSGDIAAFEALYRAYLPSLVGFARRLTNEDHIAEDAVQDAWITISKTLVRLEDATRFRAWVFKTVRWRVVDLVRKKGKEAIALNDVEDSLIAASEDNKTDDSSDLRGLINALPVNEREAVYLFYLEGMSIAEIADVIKIPTGTVKSRLNRARASLRAAYSESEII
jgi:RNA polymerase sigma-70 factor (ECF subfamily)